jgi:ribose-phosphate pyrophosphokinase
VVAGTQTNDDIVELISICSTLVTLGAKRLNIIIPYFGYSTMERSTKFGEVVAAKIRATMLSHIPRASYGNKFYFVDLHTPVITEFFEGGLYTHQINTTGLIQTMCNDISGGGGFVLATTDVGRAKSIEYIARSYHEDAHVETAFCYKRRNSGSSTDITGVNADVKGKKVVIYDDMIRSGSSLIKAAEVYKREGASEIFAVSSHGVFSRGWQRNFDDMLNDFDDKTIKKITVTNSHPNSIDINKISNNISVFSIANIVGKALLD